ncbi:MAG: DUF4129 domain-containing protein [Candidatus Saliniplasma sp.]
MKQIDKQTKFILAVSLVLLASWVIGSMIHAVPDITTEEEDLIAKPGEEPVEMDLYDEGYFSLFLNTLFALVIGILSGSIMSFLVVKDRDLLGQIFTIVVIALGLSIFIYVDMDLKISSLFRGRHYDLNWLDLGSLSVRGVTIGIISLLSIVLFILMVISINTFFRSPTRMKKYQEIEVDIEEDKKEVAEEISRTVDRAVEELSRGDDIREVIISVYQDVCTLLEESGVSNEDTITPREFKRKASRSLDIDEDVIKDITKTFEEARYSIHRLEEGDRERILNEFKKLKKEVEVMF